MNVEQLVQAAVEVVNSPLSNDLVVKMNGHLRDSGDYIFLSGRTSPKGLIVSAFTDCVVVRFDAVDVLAWCVANGYAKVLDINTYNVDKCNQMV